jgi:hypothetical protein
MNHESVGPEAAVEVVDDALFPGPAHDLCRETTSCPRLAHDVIGDLVSTLDEVRAGHDFVDESIVECLRGPNGLSGQQRVRGALGAKELLERVVDAIGGNRTDVEVQVEDRDPQGV